MNSDLIKQLFHSFINKDNDSFLKAANEIIKNEERKKHRILVKELKEILNKNIGIYSYGYQKRLKEAIPIPRDIEKGFPLLEIKEFHLDWLDVILANEVVLALKKVIQEFDKSEILATYGIKPKQKLLFCGPPGTGKTLTAQLMSSLLGYPMAYIRFDAIISSYLGETATNLRKIFDFFEQGRWVVLFDEFDVIGKHRDDHYEHGEIKRVVNNFLQMLDNFMGDSLIIAATNHQHLLDPALWRRFDETLYFDIPDEKRRILIFEKYLRVITKDSSFDIKQLSKQTDGMTPAEIALICFESIKNSVLNDRDRVEIDDLTSSIMEQKRRRDIKGRTNGVK
ncbi:MAG: AAA family ATPase [Nitrospirota bacterium]